MGHTNRHMYTIFVVLLVTEPRDLLVPLFSLQLFKDIYQNLDLSTDLGILLNLHLGGLQSLPEYFWVQNDRDIF